MARTSYAVPLAGLTTLRLGGPARRLVEVDTEADLVEVVSAADAAGEPVLVLGDGSNVVVSDDGVDGTVVAVRTRGVHAEVDGCAGAWVTVAAGEPWDDLVARAVAEEWSGIEALAGIPGRTGAAPIQNVGAYGQEVADTLARVRVLDRVERRVRMLPLAECGFGYRWSRFKAEPGRFVVLEVALQLRPGSMSAPVRYAELAARLGVGLGDRAPLGEVRDAVLALRRGKGMVLDPDDHDTWSAGSFFTNPVLDADAAAALPGDAPRFPVADGRVKTSAAWLIDRAGRGRGYGLAGRPAAGVSDKHALALTNRGGASTADLLALAADVRAEVARRFGVVLEPEPVLVGCDLGPL
ncbi:MAG: UDP-N-acetylmuramate dehydrogenase [Candidatus Nanopelagicales bacterium]